MAWDDNTQIVNCVFTGNEAGSHGGAVKMGRLDDTTSFTNCTFYDNYTTGGAGDGGALWASLAYPRITNCILWGNTDGGEGEGNDVFLTSSAKHTTFRHCDIYDCGGSGDDWKNDKFGMDADGNIDANPDFKYTDDPDGPDNAWGTWDDGLKLQWRGTTPSPCIDAADGDAAPERDMTGRLRFDMSVSDKGTGEPDYADIGAYEAPSDLQVVVMCWINESGSGYCPPYGSVPNYNEDLTNYRNLIATLGIVRSGCYVPPYQGNPGDPTKVLPEGYSPPEEVTMGGFPAKNDIVLSDFTSRFNNLVQGGIEPEYVLLIVDNSGSMYTSHIEPHYSEATGDNFKEWITDSENYPNAVIKTQDGASDFTNERWLEAMRLLLEDALEEL